MRSPTDLFRSLLTGLLVCAPLSRFEAPRQFMKLPAMVMIFFSLVPTPVLFAITIDGEHYASSDDDLEPNVFWEPEEVIFEGGTLIVTGSFRTSRDAEVSYGGGTIETQGISHLIWDGEFSGTGDETLTKTGMGTLELREPSVGDFGINLYGGVLAASSGALGTGDIEYRNEVVLRVSGSVANNIQGGGGSLTIMGNNGPATFSGSITSGSLDFRSGTFTLADDNSLGGTITVTDATLRVSQASALGFADVYLPSSGAFELQGGTLSLDRIVHSSTGEVSGLIYSSGSGTFTSAEGTYRSAISGSGSFTKLNGGGTVTFLASQQYTGDTTIEDGTLRLAGSGNIRGDVNVLAYGNLHFDDGGRTYAGSISGQGSVNKSGWGTTFLTGSNTYIGGTTISEGVLRLGDSGTVLHDYGSVTIHGGTFLLGADETIGSLSGSGGFIDLGLGGGYALTVNQTKDGNFAGTLEGNGGALVKNGHATLILSEESTFGGGTTVNAGTLRAAHANAFGTGAVQVNSGVLDLNSQAIGNAITMNGGSLVNASAYTGTQTVTSASSWSGTVGGAMQVAAGGIANTTGATFSGNTSVLSGGTLTGSGTFRGNGAIAGTLAPGNSPGLMTFEGDLTLEPTATLLFEIGGYDRGVEYDAVDVGGDLTYGGDLALSLISGFTPEVGDTFVLFDVVGNYSGSFTNIDFQDGLGGTFDYSTGTLTIIPEPSTWAVFLGAFALGLAAWRRHRRRRA